MFEQLLQMLVEAYLTTPFSRIHLIKKSKESIGDRIFIMPIGKTKSNMVNNFSLNFSITDKETHCCLSVLLLNFFAFLRAVLSPPKQKTASGSRHWLFGAVFLLCILFCIGIMIELPKAIPG